MARHMPTVAKIQPPISAMTATTTMIMSSTRLGRHIQGSLAHSPDRKRQLTVRLVNWADVQINSHVMGQDDTVYNR